MATKPSITWQERIVFLLGAISPFLFIVVMGSIRPLFGLTSESFSTLLQNPTLLVLSALFANAGTEAGLRVLDRTNDSHVRTRVRYAAMGVTLTFVILAIAHLITNGGVVNPK